MGMKEKMIAYGSTITLVGLSEIFAGPAKDIVQKTISSGLGDDILLAGIAGGVIFGLGLTAREMSRSDPAVPRKPGEPRP